MKEKIYIYMKGEKKESKLKDLTFKIKKILNLFITYIFCLVSFHCLPHIQISNTLLTCGVEVGKI